MDKGAQFLRLLKMIIVANIPSQLLTIRTFVNRLFYSHDLPGADIRPLYKKGNKTTGYKIQSRISALNDSSVCLFA